jgi:hypothetical protein
MVGHLCLKIDDSDPDLVRFGALSKNTILVPARDKTVYRISVRETKMV